MLSDIIFYKNKTRKTKCYKSDYNTIFKKPISLRNARNRIAHEYPDDINFIYEYSDYLIELTDRLERYFDEITTQRNSSKYQKYKYKLL